MECVLGALVDWQERCLSAMPGLLFDPCMSGIQMAVSQRIPAQDLGNAKTPNPKTLNPKT